MDAIIDDLALCIIELCDPHSLSNLSLVDKQYHGILHGNSVLMLLSIRHEVKLESFEEYQLLCEIRYLVPEASKHYDMNYYQTSIDGFYFLPNIDDMIRKLDESCNPIRYHSDNGLEVMYKYLYEHDAHITGNLNPEDHKILKIKSFLEIYDIDEGDYLRYLIKQCPDTKTVMRYWDKHIDVIISNSEEIMNDLFWDLFDECISSVYCIERLHWLHSINLDRSREHFNEMRKFHPYILNYVVTHRTFDQSVAIFERVENDEFDGDELMKIGNEYKYGERVDKLMKKMKW